MNDSSWICIWFAIFNSSSVSQINMFIWCIKCALKVSSCMANGSNAFFLAFNGLYTIIVIPIEAIVGLWIAEKMAKIKHQSVFERMYCVDLVMDFSLLCQKPSQLECFDSNSNDINQKYYIILNDSTKWIVFWMKKEWNNVDADSKWLFFIFCCFSSLIKLFFLFRNVSTIDSVHMFSFFFLYRWMCVFVLNIKQ